MTYAVTTDRPQAPCITSPKQQQPPTEQDQHIVTQLLIMQREIREMRLANDMLKEKALLSENLERKIRDLNYEIHDIQSQAQM